MRSFITLVLACLFCTVSEPSYAAFDEENNYADYEYIIRLISHDPGRLAQVIGAEEAEEEGQFEFYLEIDLMYWKDTHFQYTDADLDLDLEGYEQIDQTGTREFDREEVVKGGSLVDLWGSSEVLGLKLQPAEWSRGILGKWRWGILGSGYREHRLGSRSVGLDEFPIGREVVLTIWDLPDAEPIFGCNSWAKTKIGLERRYVGEKPEDEVLLPGTYPYLAHQWWIHEAAGESSVDFRYWKSRRDLLIRIMKYADVSQTDEILPRWAEEVRREIEQYMAYQEPLSRYHFLRGLVNMSDVSDEDFFSLIEIFDPTNVFGFRLSRLGRERVIPDLPPDGYNDEDDFVLRMIDLKEELEEEKP